MNLRHSNEGLSIVGVLVTAGLLSIVGIGMAYLAVVSLKHSARVEGVHNVAALVQAIALNTFNQPSCKAMLPNNISINYNSVNSSSQIPFQLNLHGVEPIAVDQIVSTYGLVVKKFELRNIFKIGVDTSSNDYIAGRLFLTTDNATEVSGGKKYTEQLVTTIYLKLNSSGLAIDCAGSSLLPN